MGLRKNARFDQVEETKVDGRDVIIIRGSWKNRDGLLDPRGAPISPTAPLPPYVPGNVQITIGKDDFWPYQVKMYGNAPSLVALQEDTRPIGQDGRPIGIKRPPPKIKPSTVTLDYTLLPVSAITEGKFVFQAPTDSTNPPIDDTEQFLAGLDQYIMVETERRKADAAKGEANPLLKESLLVPRPEASTPGADLGIMPKAEPAKPQP